MCVDKFSLQAWSPVQTKQHPPEGVSELRNAEGVDGWINKGVTHEQYHMQLEKWAVTLAVRVHGAHHEYDEMDKKRRPAHHKGSEQDGEGQGSSHAVAPPLLTAIPSTPTGGQSSNLPGMDACQHKHVDVERVDDCQGDDEEDNEADHDDLWVEEPHHEHRWDATCCPDDTQDGPRAPHRHNVVVSKGVEYGDVTENDNNKIYI